MKSDDDLLAALVEASAKLQQLADTARAVGRPDMASHARKLGEHVAALIGQVVREQRAEMECS